MHARGPRAYDHSPPAHPPAANDNVAPRPSGLSQRQWWHRIANDPALLALYLLLMGVVVTVGYSGLGALAFWWLTY